MSIESSTIPAPTLRARVRRIVLSVGLVTLSATLLLLLSAGRVDPWLTWSGLASAAFVTALAWVPRAQALLDRYDWLLASPVMLVFIAGTGGGVSPHRGAWLLIAVYAASFLPTPEFVLALATTTAAYLAPAAYSELPADWLRFSIVELVGYGMVIMLVRLLAVRSDRLLEHVGEHERAFEALFDDNPLPMLMVDGTGRVTRVNRLAALLSPDGQLQGQQLRDVDGMPGGPVDEAIAQAIHGEVAVFDIEVRVGGEMRAYETTAVPAPGADGEVSRVFVIGRDVTDERRARAAILRRSEQQAALAELGMDATVGMELDELMDRTAELLVGSLPCDNASVMVPRDGGLVLAAYRGPEPGIWRGRWLPVEGSLGGHVFASGQALVSSDFWHEDRFEVPAWLRSSPARSGLAVPIEISTGRWGVLAAANHAARDWTGDDLAFVQSVANVLAATVERRAVERRLRESEERFRRMADDAQDVVFRLLPDPARLAYVNPAVEEVLGTPPRDWVESPELLTERIDAELLAGELPDGPAPAHVPTRELLPVRHADGHVVWLEVTRTPVFDEGGAVVAVDGIARDVTARRRSEHLLQEALEQEQRVADELRRIDEMKDDFLAAVSHELRTPLASVLGFALTIEQSRARMTDEQLEVLSRRLSTNAKKLDRLLSDLLDLDRMRRSVVEPELREVDLGQLVTDVAAAHRSAGRRLVVETDRVIASVDPPMVERIVENLIGNAVKHTAPDRTVWARVERDGGDAVISVEDDGVGVPAELRDRIFQPFERGPHDRAHAPGTGIGLSLVARFAELHGGTAWVAERRGGGASFNVRLPLTAGTSDDATTGAGGERRGSR